VSLFRSITGAVLGAAVAGAALRLKYLADQPGVSLSDAAAQLPDALKDDVARVREAAEGAWRDGLDEAKRQEAEIDKVLSGARRKRGSE
jgi:gas vesicle protein